MRYRALLVAIDDYGNPRNNLPSCVNDQKYVSEVLRGKLQVPDESIKTLINGQATVEAVQGGLEWLTSDTAEDERLLFFYSGHGFQLPPANGRVDEALVLSQDGFFRDDALVKSSHAARPGTLTVLFDCCFGGGNEKMFQPSGDFGAFVAPKRWSPPTAYLMKTAAFASAEAVAVSSYKPFASRPITSKTPPSVVLSAAGATRWPTAIDEAGQPLINGALLAACTEDETATASTPETEGLSAFTYALKRLIERQGLDLTLHEAQEGTDRILKNMGFRQTSTLKIGTGPIDRDSRFLSLGRRAEALSGFIDRRVDMADAKFVEALVERVIRELTQKGYEPASAHSDKFLPGIGYIAPIIVNRIIDELTKKNYRAKGNGSDKSLLGDIAREVIERTVRELTKKDFTPPPAGIGKFGLGDVAEIIIRELTKQGYVPSSDDGSDKDFRWMPEPIIAEVVRHFTR